MKKKLRVLIIDKVKEQLAALNEILVPAEYETIQSTSTEEALKIAANVLPDLIITELLMPGMDGIEFCLELRMIKELDETSIVFYTERNDDYSHITALNSGADDYIIKPTRPRLFLKKIGAILKRHKMLDHTINQPIPNGLVINKEEYLVYNDGKRLVLPRKEFELLYLLSQTPQKVVTREEIVKLIWGYEMSPDNRTLDVHVRKIRKKLGGNYIKTIRGVGYILSIAEPISI